MVMAPWKQDQANARASLRRAAGEAVARGSKLRLDQRTAALIRRATGAADLGPEVLIGLLVISLEQANLAPVPCPGAGGQVAAAGRGGVAPEAAVTTPAPPMPVLARRPQFLQGAHHKAGAVLDRRHSTPTPRDPAQGWGAVRPHG